MTEGNSGDSIAEPFRLLRCPASHYFPWPTDLDPIPDCPSRTCGLPMEEVGRYVHETAYLDECSRLATALSQTASVLYDVWRCNTDEERSAFGSIVGRTVEDYAKHPSHLIAAPNGSTST